MKWINPNKKEPPFNKKLVLLHEDDTWDEGYLEEIVTNGGGKYFIFKGGENEFRTVKLYMEIEPPKTKE